jgi:hypothetical protein
MNKLIFRFQKVQDHEYDQDWNEVYTTKYYSYQTRPWWRFWGEPITKAVYSDYPFLNAYLEADDSYCAGATNLL